jgi:hypothetical protein
MGLLPLAAAPSAHSDEAALLQTPTCRAAKMAPSILQSEL